MRVQWVKRRGLEDLLKSNRCRVSGWFGPALVGLVLAIAPSRASALLPYSVELDGIASYSTISPFTDASNMFGAWAPYGGNPAPTLSDDNYPTLGSMAETSTALNAYPGWRQGTPGNRPIINYQVTWDGGAAGGASVFFINRQLTLTAPPVALPNGQFRYTATLPFQYDSQSGESSLILRIDNSIAGQTSAVSNLHLIPQQYINPQNGTAPVYREEFLRKVSPFSVLRFMDWQQTNIGGLSNLPHPQPVPFVDNRVLNWSDRVKTTSFSRTGNQGVPWEEIITLSNAFVRHDTQNNVVSKKDIWINIPDRATDNYISGLGDLLKLSLDPSINIYLEYSNELWNTTSDVDRWKRVLQDAKANTTPQGTFGVAVNDGLDPGNDNRLVARQTAFQLTHAAEILRTILDNPNTSASASRIKPILGGQTPNLSIAQYAVDFLASRKYGPAASGYKVGNLSSEISAVAIAPYVGNDLGAAEPVYPNPPASNDPDYAAKLAQYNADRQAYLNWLFPVLNSFVDNELKAGVASHKAMANAYGVNLESYEGGQHLIAANHVLNIDVNSGYKQDANRDARMGALYTHLLSMWATESGGGIFNQFSLVSPYSNFGSWGLLEELGQTSSPKWDVFLNILAGDANLDGVVDFTDFQILETNFNQQHTLWDQGDFNLDGKVDYLDFLIFRQRFAPADPDMASMVDSFGASAVPEPGSLALVGLAGAALLGRRKRAA